jgi:hypothetical protein
MHLHLYDGVEIENFRDLFIVSIDELTAHGSFGKNKKGVHTVN